jgi:hypothetical protein
MEVFEEENYSRHCRHSKKGIFIIVAFSFIEESLRPTSPSVKPMPSATLKPPVKQKTRSTIDYKMSLLENVLPAKENFSTTAYSRHLKAATIHRKRH